MNINIRLAYSLIIDALDSINRDAESEWEAPFTTAEQELWETALEAVSDFSPSFLFQNMCLGRKEYLTQLSKLAKNLRQEVENNNK